MSRSTKAKLELTLVGINVVGISALAYFVGRENVVTGLIVAFIGAVGLAAIITTNLED